MEKKQLKHKFIRGNKKAFDTIYMDYSNAMYAVCLRYTNNTDEAADILQNAFIKIYENRKKFNPEYNLQGWIKKIVVNTAINHYRKNKKTVLIDEDNYFDNDLDTEFEIDHIPNIGKILTATLQQLPDGYRMVFNLYVLENLTHQEIADYLNISINTSKSQLSRAKQMLKKILLDKNITKTTLLNAERA